LSGSSAPSAGRPFANQWEFVAWARRHRPDLDCNNRRINFLLPQHFEGLALGIVIDAGRVK
jgi:hypothetical protein